MQHSSDPTTIHSLPMFRRLVALRNRWRFALALLTLLCHAFFIGGVTIYRDFFSTPLSQNSTITVGIAGVALVLVLFIVLEYVYIRVSEKKLDPLQADVVEEVNKHA